MKPPSETAQRHLVTRVPSATPSTPAAEAFAALRGATFDAADSIVLCDEAGRYAGIVPLPALLAAPPATRLAELAHPKATAVSPETDQEHVATHAVHAGLASVPVADHEGRLLGVVPVQALLAILRHEHVEDLHRLAGIRREARHARAAIEGPPVRRVRDRVPWLILGLLGSFVSALVVRSFAATLEARVAIAYFLPAIVYLADAIGTQTEAIVVRGLIYSRSRPLSLFWSELRTGVLIGIVLAALLFPAALLVLGDARLAIAVALTVVVAGGVATTVGLLFPLALVRLGRDPAFGSGPVATIVQDVLSLLVYFGIVSAVVTISG
jgi:magnesium transporter